MEYGATTWAGGAVGVLGVPPIRVANVRAAPDLPKTVWRYLCATQMFPHHMQKVTNLDRRVPFGKWIACAHAVLSFGVLCIFFAMMGRQSAIER